MSETLNKLHEAARAGSPKALQAYKVLIDLIEFEQTWLAKCLQPSETRWIPGVNLVRESANFRSGWTLSFIHREEIGDPNPTWSTQPGKVFIPVSPWWCLVPLETSKEITEIFEGRNVFQILEWFKNHKEDIWLDNIKVRYPDKKTINELAEAVDSKRMAFKEFSRIFFELKHTSRRLVYEVLGQEMRELSGLINKQYGGQFKKADFNNWQIEFEIGPISVMVRVKEVEAFPFCTKMPKACWWFRIYNKDSSADQRNFELPLEVPASAVADKIFSEMVEELAVARLNQFSPVEVEVD